MKCYCYYRISFTQLLCQLPFLSFCNLRLDSQYSNLNMYLFFMPDSVCWNLVPPDYCFFPIIVLFYFFSFTLKQVISFSTLMCYSWGCMSPMFLNSIFYSYSSYFFILFIYFFHIVYNTVVINIVRMLQRFS